MSNKNYNGQSSKYDEILKDIMLWIGVGLAVLSIYFSWDGLYKSVPTDKASTDAAKWIGLLLAVGFTGLQFIFNSDFRKLNATLFVLGLVSYVYSILTNKWGITDLFGFPEPISWILAFGMDVAPEAMISWALEDVHKGDMIGNILGKLGSLRRGNFVETQRYQHTFTPEQDTQPRMKTPQQQNQRKGKGRAYWEEESTRQQGQSREKPSRFGMFEE